MVTFSQVPLDVIFYFLILLFLSGFFSSAELAMMSLSRFHVDQLVREKRHNARLLLKLKQNPHKLLTTILIGNNLVNIAAAAIATSLAINLFGSMGIGIATGVTTFLVLLFGEIIPKSVAVNKARTMALIFSPVLAFLQFILFPIIFIIDLIASVFTRFFGEPEKEHITEQEVAEIAVLSERQGQIKRREREMIQNVLAFDTRTVEEVMTPRLDVFSLEMHLPLKEAMPQIIASGFSRIPVYDKKMDKMKGVVLVKDLLPLMDRKIKLQDAMKPVLFVPENKKLDVLLREFQKKKSPFALVIDEHGLFIGLLTVEDILEELVGEIYDEADKVETRIKKIDKNTFLVSGKASIQNLNDRQNLGIPQQEDYDTLAGYLMDRMGRIPTDGEEFSENNLLFTIERVLGNRIAQVKVSRTPAKRKSHPKHH